MRYLTTIVFILCIYAVRAQWSADKLSLAATYHYHHFYDSGVYELGNTNSATARGIGLQGRYSVRPKLVLGLGYHFSVLDKLAIGENIVEDDFLHQLDFNVEWKPFELWKLQPFLYTGYGIKAVPVFKDFNRKSRGVAINLGTGADLPLNDWIDLRYQMNYNFSLSENIPYFFRHQWGIVIHPSTLKSRMSGKGSSSSPLVLVNQDSLIYELRDSLATAVENESAEKTNWTYRVESLEEYVLHLEKENQLLLGELRSKRLFSDSLFNIKLSGYTIVDTTGQVLRISGADFEEGYYLLSGPLPLLSDAASLSMKWSDESLVSYILNRNDQFYVISYLDKNKTVAYTKYATLGEDRYLYRIVKL